jgi:TonB family protein
LGARSKSQQRRDPVIEELEPADGWSSYNEYLAKSLKEPDLAKEKNTHGEVELSFEVNSTGEPINIKVVRSLGKAFDEEAIRLLKEGPKWKKKSRNKGKVTIRF